MERKTYHRHNFFKHTFCIFTEVPRDVLADRVPDHKSSSGSSYYFTPSGVYRLSNHWGRAANCRWRLETADRKQSGTRLGYAGWNDFYANNDQEAFYYIGVDYETKTVQFYHKDAPDYDGIAILRNAAETARHIRDIRNLFENESWAKYMDYDDLDTLRIAIIATLVTTKKSLQQIKAAYVNP